MGSIVLRSVNDFHINKDAGSSVTFTTDGSAAICKKVGSASDARAYLTKSFPIRPGATYTFSIEAKVSSEKITGGIYIDYPHNSNYQNFKFNQTDWKLYKISFTVPPYTDINENWQKSVMKISAGIVTGGTEGEVILKNPVLIEENGIPAPRIHAMGLVIVNASGGSLSSDYSKVGIRGFSLSEDKKTLYIKTDKLLSSEYQSAVGFRPVITAQLTTDTRSMEHDVYVGFGVDDEMISVKLVKKSDNTVVDISQLTGSVAFFISSIIN